MILQILSIPLSFGMQNDDVVRVHQALQALGQKGVFRRFGDWRVGEHTARRGRLSPATRRTDAGPAAATGPAWLAHSPGA